MTWLSEYLWLNFIKRRKKDAKRKEEMGDTQAYLSLPGKT